MNTKTIITAVLLLFVGISIGYVIKQPANMCSQTEPSTNTACQRQGDCSSPSTNCQNQCRADGPSQTQSDKTVVYYFHTTQRCMTCNKLEQYTKEAVESVFGEQAQNGNVEFQAINTDLPEHQHFIRDYKLVTKSVVLVNYQDQQPAGWTTLDLIWEKVGDKTEYLAYIANETTTFLKESQS